MAFNDAYRRQVELLVRTLPHVAQEDCFALKGGTAINFFVRDLPRLSVDIDLAYLPIADRDQSLNAIEWALKRIAERIRRDDPMVTITQSAPKTQRTMNKIVVRTPNRVQIKIEVTPVLRGCVYEPAERAVTRRVQEGFGFAEMTVVSLSDLYAGKIVAALDRQHPRDLFDVHQLMAHEGIDEDLRTALIIYLISHNTNLHQLLDPTLKDVSDEFERGFKGMTEEPVDLKDLLSARRMLIDEAIDHMPVAHKRFLISFVRGKPEWGHLDRTGLDTLPAVRWRMLNLDRVHEATRQDLVERLEKVLWPV